MRVASLQYIVTYQPGNLDSPFIFQGLLKAGSH